MAADPGHFEPIHSAHAIEQVLFVLQFERHLDDVQLAAAIEEIHPQFQDELPGKIDIQGYAMSFGPMGMGQRILPSGGRIFSSTRKDSTVENELRIQRDSIAFRTTAYSRWDEVWVRARRYFAAVIPNYASAGVSVAATNLNFQDKFYWVGDVSLCRPNRLLRPGSQFICPHIYETKDLWHSHTGAFIRADDGAKRLINVNLDCLDEPAPPARRVVAITTAITDQVNQPGYSQMRVEQHDILPYLERQMGALHNQSLATFRNVISDEMCKRIALEG